MSINSTRVAAASRTRLRPGEKSARPEAKILLPLIVLLLAAVWALNPGTTLGDETPATTTLKEAEAVYAEFTYLFDEIFPELVDKIQYYRQCMKEGFPIPPKWIEIYGYQLMHEL